MITDHVFGLAARCRARGYPSMPITTGLVTALISVDSHHGPDRLPRRIAVISSGQTNPTGVRRLEGPQTPRNFNIRHLEVSSRHLERIASSSSSSALAAVPQTPFLLSRLEPLPHLPNCSSCFFSSHNAAAIKIFAPYMADVHAHPPRPSRAHRWGTGSASELITRARQGPPRGECRLNQLPVLDEQPGNNVLRMAIRCRVASAPRPVPTADRPAGRWQRRDGKPGIVADAQQGKNTGIALSERREERILRRN